MNEDLTLLDMIRGSDLVGRVKTLRDFIESHPEYLKEYQDLLSLQKRLVRADQGGNSPEADKIRELYEQRRDSLLDHPAIGEYLHAVEELNDLVQEVSEIVENGIR